MRRTAVTIALAAAIALSAAAPAYAVPYLSFGEASRQIGSTLHAKAHHGAVSGSLDAYCERYRRNKVGCDISWWSDDGYTRCGYGQVIATQRVYRTRIYDIHVC